jgi:amino acid adenylation domain-containing protein
MDAIQRPTSRPDEPPRLAPEPQRMDLPALLRHEVARVARLPPGAIARDRPLLSLGLDSLAVIELQYGLEQTLGVAIALEEMLAGIDLAGLEELARAALEERGSGAAAIAATADAGRELPLSPGQLALWLLQRAAAASGPLHIAAAARVLALDGRRLDGATLGRCLEALAERHPVLRAVFEERDGGPVQRLGFGRPPELVEVDAAAWSEQELDAWSEREAYRPFDLATGPLLRIAIARRAGGEDALVFAIHHLVADFWSVALLVRELSALYLGEPLAPPALSYGDYLRWQAERLASAEAERLWAYWCGELSPPVASLALPGDRPRPAVWTYRGGAVSLSLGAGLSAELAALARRGSTTLFATLLAGFQAVLGRASGQLDLVVGAPAAGRGRPELAGLAGYFVNLVALRAELAGDPSFLSLLGQARGRVRGALEHQDLPFAWVAERLLPKPDPAGAPWLQALFVLQKARAAMDASLAAFALGERGARLDFGGSWLESRALPERWSQFDLVLRMAEVDGDLVASLQFSSDLFERSTASRMLGHLRELLAGAAADPDRPLSALALLSAAERQQLFAEWNDTADAALLPADSACLHALVERQVARAPEATAAVFGGDHLSFGELGARAGRLARCLRRLGVGPEVRVGVAAERSLELPIALLAALKAGGAYVPLDPSYPKERLAFMIEDSRLPVLLTQSSVAARLPVGGARVLLLDADPAGPEPDTEDEEEGWAAAGAGAEGLAYVIYTSGSTGRPKGAMNTHRAIVNRLLWMQRAYGLRPADAVLQKTPTSFDVSVWELFWPLLAGARLVLARPGGQQDADYLARLIEEEGVTTVHFVPSMLQAFLAEPGLGALPSLRRVVASGEALPASLVERFFARLGAELHNLYGPTEAAVDVTAWACERGASRRAVPLGRPIGNLVIRLLDRCGRPVPAGVPGELHIGGLGGAGLARGYLGRPELTAERFVPDPLAAEPGERLYATGDLARYLPEGAIEYLGRLDHQHKLRGFRIELEEIEAVLREHPAVAEAVVALREDRPGDPRLVAYAVPDEEARRTASAAARWTSPCRLAADLRQVLGERLPEFMVPSAVVLLDALPLSPSGKVDRRALPAAELAGDGGDGALSGAPPDTPVAEMLAGIWREILGASEVRRDDSFFELGGHSLKATQLRSRVRAAFELDLPLPSFFAAPTLRQQAELVERALRRPDAAAEVPITPVERRSDLPLSFAQERLWFLDQLAPGAALYNVPLVADLTGRLDVAALGRSLGELVRRHESLRTTFARAAAGAVQGIAPPVPPPHPVQAPLPVIDVSPLPAAARAGELEWLSLGEARRPFDLAQGPLMRATLLRAGRQEHRLLICLHHIVTDGWSTGVLVRELSALYGGFTGGAPVSLPELAIQYADYAVWQRRWLAGEVLAGQMAYWRRQLAGQPVVELPTDRPRPAVESFRGASRPAALAPALTEPLRALARGAGATLYMVLLAAFDVLVGSYSGTTDIVVGSPVANRSRRETEDLLGFFVNTLVMRTSLAGDPSLRTLLGRVRETALGAYVHQDLPFEKLVEELRPQRDLSRNPLFQLMLVLQNAPLPCLALPGLTVMPRRLDLGIAKLDLTLVMEEEEGRLVGQLEHSTALFDGTTMLRLLTHYEALLAQVVADPDLPLSALLLLSAAERQQLLAEWNDTARAPARGPWVHELVAARARRWPDALAIAEGTGHLSYGELQQRAGVIARALRRLGVAPEVRVGVCLERSPELVAACLAVLQAGGAYVALDPSHPAERLGSQLADSQVPVLLTRRGRLAELAAGQGVRCLFPHEVAEDGPEGGLPELPPPALEPGNLAYVIYTSGSTGRPKGVELSHAALRHLVALQVRLLAIGPADRTTLLASVGFDAVVFETWVYLTVGASLHVPPDALRASPAGLCEWMTEQGITVNFLPTVLAEGVVDLGWDGDGPRPALRSVLAAGDRLHRYPPASLPFELLNAYGPTEATVIATAGRVPAGHPRWHLGQTPTIGRPLDDIRVHVVETASGEPRPVGVPGELLIGGAGVGRGYLHRPDRTAERFVPDPFATAPGERLYRTGDLVRWSAEGELEFLGRVDHQVKVRGCRVELGEIEAALLRCPGVREAVVTARRDVAGEIQLVAHLAAEPGAELEWWQVRERLAGALPDFMLPSAWVHLPALPQTPSGKVDRTALAAAAGAPESAAEHVAPRTPIEELVATLWADLLGVERVGARDDFFALGGHSLSAAKLVSRLREAFGVELPVRALFESPTVAALAAAVERSRGEGIERAAAPPLAALPRGGPLPLSLAQERLWFLERLEPGGAVYNIPLAACLRGDLDTAALAAALSAVVQRQESLRTTLEVAAGGPVQVVAAPRPVLLPCIDLGGVGGPEGDAEAWRLARREARRPFDLGAGPLLRTLLLRWSPDKHLLVLVLHHVIADGWSLGVLLSELSELYGSAVERHPPSLPELPVQYGDYAVWQRRWLGGCAPEGPLGYWRERLAAAPEALELPTDRPRPVVQSGRGASLPMPLSDALARELGALSRRTGTTLFMALLAGFAALLSRLSGQEDLVVGTPVANRDRTEIEGLIGFFVNTLPLRLDLAGDPPFGELLGRVREVALGAYAYQAVPFERLVEELKPRRDRSRNPLFQAMLALQSGLTGQLRLPGLAVQPQPLHTGTAKFDLTLALAEADGLLAGGVEYAADLFDAATVRRMVGQLGNLLTGAAADAKLRVSDLPLLAAAERHALRLEWSGMLTSYPRESAIHELFEERVRRAADRIALVADEEQMSYGELDAQAAHLARHLRARGVGAEALVAFCLESPLAAVVATLAILKAGGAYLPLDPASPKQRIAAMLEQARGAAESPLLLTAASLVERLHWVEERGWRAVDIELAAQAAAPQADGVQVRPENLAYVMFTSGSTGRPKGVAVTHRGVVRLVKQTAYATFGDEEVFLHLAPVSFDAATLEIWGPLLNGGRLVLMPPGVPSSSEVGEAIARHQVTTLWLTAGWFHQIVEQDVAQLVPLRQLLAGGDVLSPAHVGRVLRELPRTRLINGYGPTEATTFTCAWPVQEEPVGAVSIGRPIANTWVRVLGPDLRSVPVGVAGELWIGGDGLARGYLGQPDLTAERFLPDAEADGAGERLYRTGDRARWLPDGCLELLGRLDRQVKVRGFRVELAEVEAALARCPEVAEAAVLMREDTPGDRRLTAYVVARRPGGLAGLRSSLRELLPEPMIPAAFVWMDSLPRTANGKLDRRSLPAPEGLRPELAASYVAPRTPVEELLASIWMDLLGLERVGVGDDFFELGGHSLLATRLVSRLREPFGVELPVRTLFEARTVAALAAAVEAAGGESGAVAPPLLPSPRIGSSLPLSLAQERLWFLEQLEPGGAVYNLPLAARLVGSLAPAALAAGLSGVARRHESLRTGFAVVSSGPVQVVSEPRAVALPRIDLSGFDRSRRESEARRLGECEARRPFDLGGAPLLRAVLVWLEAEEHLLFAVVHHLVADGWSLGVLLSELSELYAACVERRRPSLPELPVQYGDYAVWQRQWLGGGALDRQLGYWRERLVAAPEALELPTDRPRPAVQGRRGASLPAALSEDLARSLGALSRRQGSTLFMTLLAGFAALLGRWSGQRDLVVGVPVAQRDRGEIEGLIGFFVNTLPLRLDLSGDPSFGELVRRVRETSLGAYGHQAVPFARLVEELRPRRDRSRSPVFQVMFALQSGLAGQLRLRGLAVEVQPLHTGTAKFDLTLALSEPGDLLGGSVEYDTDLFDAATVRRLVGQLDNLLAGAAADAEVRVDDLPLLAAAERHALVFEWSGTAAAFARGAGLHELFEAQAARTPQSVALAWRGERVCYGEIDRRAERLAGRLRRLGVGPEVLVGVFLTRRPEMLIAMLGVLKAGGAYLPLDPVYPEERLAFLLSDSGARVVVAEPSLAASLPAFGGEVVRLDAGGEAADGGEPVRPRSDPRRLGWGDPQQLAYVIYTSGSTGVPKGVAIRHRSAVARLSWAVESYGRERLGGVLASTSICFDLSVFELFAPLAAGGTVVLVNDALDLLRSPELPVTLLNTVPSAMSELLRLGAIPGSVRTVNLAGEALRRELADGLCALPQVESLYNLYGPSEDTTYSTVRRIAPEESGQPTIGRALPNTRAYVLDGALRPVPLGVVGDLWLSGEGLARGYLHRPRLTAERFRPDPFGSAPGGRVYDTGDRARVLPDGDLAWLGRCDHQVKLRGFRVELGEVEAALLRHAGVMEAAVALQAQGGGGPRLVAYVVPTPGVALSGLAVELRRSLPGYMVPSAWVELSALPRTVNGKLDRRSLPAPDGARPELAASYVAPRTPVEELLASIWMDLLGLDRVGIADDFFELGGHSLLAVRLTARICDHFGVDLQVKGVFAAPTIAGQAVAIAQGLAEVADDEEISAILADLEAEDQPAKGTAT